MRSHDQGCRREHRQLRKRIPATKELDDVVAWEVLRQSVSDLYGEERNMLYKTGYNEKREYDVYK